MKITVNNKFTYRIEGQSINGEKALIDLVSAGDGAFHVIRDSKGYSVEILAADYSAKTFTIRVNGHDYDVQAQDHFDELLEKMGLQSLGSNKVENIKAPMPGLVLEILVEAGQNVQKGDSVLILEAMKMENVLKAPGDGVVQSIEVAKGNAVEKNAVLIKMG